MADEKKEVLLKLHTFTEECKNMKYLYLNTQKKLLKTCIYIRLLIKLYDIISNNDLYIADIIHFALSSNNKKYFNMTGAQKLDKLIKLKGKYMIEIKKLREKITGIVQNDPVKSTEKTNAASPKMDMNKTYVPNDDKVNFVLYISGPNYCEVVIPDYLEEIKYSSLIKNVIQNNFKVLDKINKKSKNRELKWENIQVELITQGLNDNRVTESVMGLSVTDAIRITTERQLYRLLHDINFITLDIMVKMNVDELADYIYSFSENIQNIQKDGEYIKLIGTPVNSEKSSMIISTIQYHLKHNFL